MLVDSVELVVVDADVVATLHIVPEPLQKLGG